MSDKKTVSNINLKKFYGDENSSPGNFPYKSGIYPDMYSRRLWTMRQYSGFASTEESNKRYIELLKKEQRDYQLLLIYQLKLDMTLIMSFLKVK